MQFGIFDHIEGMPGRHGPAPPGPARTREGGRPAGFFGYHLAEHHGTDLCMAPNQEIFLAAAAQVTTDQARPAREAAAHPSSGRGDRGHLPARPADRGAGRLRRRPRRRAIEHFWFEGDWFASRDRFDEALGLILLGLRTGVTGGRAGSTTTSRHRRPAGSLAAPEPADVVRRQPRRRPVRAWSGLARAIPQDAYDLYLPTWDDSRTTRAGGTPGDRAPGGIDEMLGIGDDEAKGKAIAARGWKGLMRRVVERPAPRPSRGRRGQAEGR